MRNIVLYIATSLDGYITDEKGNVNWIEENVENSFEHSSYFDFIQTVDTVILGYTTYHQIITKLSPNVWPYQDKTTYVLTHRSLESNDNIIFTQENIQDLVNKLQKQSGKDIWICGGSNIINQFLQLKLIDIYHLTIIPVILGKGISLFSTNHSLTKLKFISSKQYNNTLDIIYKNKDN